MKGEKESEGLRKIIEDEKEEKIEVEKGKKWLWWEIMKKMIGIKIIRKEWRKEFKWMRIDWKKRRKLMGVEKMKKWNIEGMIFGN